MTKRTKTTKSKVAQKKTTSAISKKTKPNKNSRDNNTNSSSSNNIHAQRNEPQHRGIHPNAIQAGIAPTSASACVSCDKKIKKNHPRWGLKYAGNPLTIPVLPLYGSHPMVLWMCGPAYRSGHNEWQNSCCGLSYVRYNDMMTNETPPAARTCHACQDAPDDTNNNVSNIRLFCGGSQKGKKIRHHVFHIACWVRSIKGSSDVSKFWLIKPEQIGRGNTTKQQTCLSWDDLTSSERQVVRKEFKIMGWG